MSNDYMQSPEMLSDEYGNFENEIVDKKQIRKSEKNPFNIKRYDDIQLPDAPIGGGGGITDTLINDYDVPKKIRLKYWYVFNKDNVLTFLDDERKRLKLLSFDISKIDHLNSVPYYSYDFAQEMEFGLVRNAFETKLDRALGLKGPVKNERILLQSQFSENRQINEMGNDGSMIKDGFFKRLLSRSR